MKKKTTKEFQQDLNNKYGNEFIIQEEYQGNKIKINFLHTVCNRIFASTPDNLLSGGVCSLCGKERRKKNIIKYNQKEKSLSREEVVQKIHFYRGEEYELIGEYINGDIPIQVLHKTCGNIFTVDLFNFVRPKRTIGGTSCICERSNRGRRRNLKEFKEEFYKCDKANEYEIFDDSYINYTSKVKLLHKSCNNVYEVLPTEFINKGCRCSKCINLGEKCYNWQGGITSISHALRTASLSWQNESREFYDYTDVILGVRGGDLEVHHVFVSFLEMLVQVLDEFHITGERQINSFSDEERIKLYDRMLELHKQKGLGIPLKKSTHQEFHQIYGTKNNTPEQFIEYAKKYHNVDLEIREDSEHRKYLARV